MPRSDSLSLHQARRIALAAQGFADGRPTGRVDRRHLRRVLDRVGVVQVDSVNVLTRSHELVFLARLGPYGRRQLAAWLWGSGEVFEYWGHEASLLPVRLHPPLRIRMRRAEAWGGMVRIAREQPELVEAVRAAVHERGPVPLGEIEEVRHAHVRRGDSMWNWSDAKRAVEWLFWTGEVAARRDPSTFVRHYAAPDRILPEDVLAVPDPGEHEALAELLLVAARAHGVATAKDLADYFRMPVPQCRPVLQALVGGGLLDEVRVEGWSQPAFLHPGARIPRRLDASALLSPFDSLIWERDRTERLFGFRYRIEIYVPAPKRVHGYYVLPFLQGEHLTARVDLKADRREGVLRVRAAHAEPGSDLAAVVAGLVERLREMAEFLSLTDVSVEDRGDLAEPLRAALA